MTKLNIQNVAAAVFVRYVVLARNDDIGMNERWRLADASFRRHIFIIILWDEYIVHDNDNNMVFEI